MISKQVLDVMECPACRHSALGIGTRRQPDLVCESCGERYPFEDGIPDMVPRTKVQEYRYYRTDTLLNLIAPIYDVAAPLMSIAIWQCSPVRYVDMAHRAIGRSNGGIFLECPVGTGLLLGHARGDHVSGPFVGVDSSMAMLKRARARFEANGMEGKVTLLRCDPANLPFADGAIRSLQSPNGLHAFHDRTAAMREFERVIEPGGNLSGSVLIRGQRQVADALLATYERYGVFPMLRSREFVIQELKDNVGFPHLRHETYGAVLFFHAEKP